MEAVLNFRQAGGVGIENKSGQRLKDGLLYRSARLDSVTLKDKSMFQLLGIKTVIDLRGKSKYVKNKEKPLQDMYTPCIIEDRVVKEICPTSERSIVNKQTLAQHYVDLLECGKFVVSDILRVVINPQNLPLLIHCAHGKDRTGIIVALILSCLDVEEEIIVNDYVKSQEELNPVRNEVIKQLNAEFGASIEFSLAKPETMREMLNELLMRYGSVSEYLVSGGFTLEEQEKLKNTLLEL